MKKEIIKIKQNLLKGLLTVIGKKKICDSLDEINNVFDILLIRQKQEIREMIERESEDMKLEGEVFYGKLNQFELVNKVAKRFLKQIK